MCYVHVVRVQPMSASVGYKLELDTFKLASDYCGRTLLDDHHRRRRTKSHNKCQMQA